MPASLDRYSGCAHLRQLGSLPSGLLLTLASSWLFSNACAKPKPALNSSISCLSLRLKLDVPMIWRRIRLPGLAAWTAQTSSDCCFMQTDGYEKQTLPFAVFLQIIGPPLDPAYDWPLRGQYLLGLSSHNNEETGPLRIKHEAGLPLKMHASGLSIQNLVKSKPNNRPILLAPALHLSSSSTSPPKSQSHQILHPSSRR